MKYLIPFLLVGGAAYLISQPTPRETVGLQRDGSVLLNSGWRLRPAGRQIPLDTFPMSTAMTPDGRFLLVLNGGYRPPSVMVLDANTLVEVSRIGVPDGWLGLAVSSNGRNVYVGGGSRASVFELALSHEGQLSMSRTFAVVPEPERKHTDFTGDVALSPDGRMLYAAQLYRDEIAVINPLSGIVIERFPTGRRPYRILFPPDGKSLFVSSWVDAAVYQHRPETGERMGLTRVGPHPTDMIWRAKQPNAEESEGGEWAARIFVAAANTNSLYVIGVNEDRSTRVVETINVAMSPRQPLGMTPSALALSPDLSRLYAVCSDANAVAAIEVSGAKSRMLGFIPSGWYPTAARVLADGRVFIANGRGSRTFANPNGPQPGVAPAISHEGIRNPGYVGNLQVGTASVVDAPSEAQIRTYTETVQELSPYNDYLLAQTRAYNAIVPASPDGSAKSPIEHVIYIVKENRTYDQVFGDLGLGNGDPSLVLFREDSTPNHRKLAREFVLLDNFYVNADVSADGHSWSSAAIAPDYVQKLWPNSYAARRKHYDYEGQELAALPPAGYLWTNALSKGLTLRNYGWWVENKPTPGGPGEVQVQSVRDPALRASTSMAFRGFSLDYPDVDRAKVFISELAEFERADKMPRLTLIRIGNDHTSGTSPGKIAPLSRRWPITIWRWE